MRHDFDLQLFFFVILLLVFFLAASKMETNTMNFRELNRNYNNEFEVCPLCKNGEFPKNADVKPSENSESKCEDIYLDLLSLNKNTSPYACQQKMAKYRMVCCEDDFDETSKMTALSTVAGVVLLYSFVRRIVKRRRARMRRRMAQKGMNQDPAEDTSIEDEISIDYMDMEDETHITKSTGLFTSLEEEEKAEKEAQATRDAENQKKSAIKKSKEPSRSTRQTKRGRRYKIIDDETFFSLQSSINSLLYTKPKRKQKRTKAKSRTAREMEIPERPKITQVV